MLYSVVSDRNSKRGDHMKNRKRLFALLLAVLIYTAALPLPVMADTGTKLVALTFDDGPGPYTEKLLDGLKKRGVHVTFFMTGENAELRPATVRRAWEEGHQICCHTKRIFHGTGSGRRIEFPQRRTAHPQTKL